MRGSIQIGKVLGIPVRVHFTFLLLVLFIGWAGWHSGGPSVGLWSMVFILLLFACVALHELAHSVVALQYGVRVESITLLPIGGVAAMEEMPRKPQQEAAMAIAGPVASIAIAGVLGGVIHLTGYAGPLTFTQQPLLPALMWTNVVLAGFNLLPAFPMDGGRVLRAILAHQLGLERATEIAVTLGQGIAVMLGLVGLFVLPGNWMLVLIAVFIFFGASQEGQQVRVQSVLERITAGHAMVRRFETLDLNQPLSLALEYASQGYQHDFPVVQGDTIVGIVTRQDLLNGLYALGPTRTVGEVMTTTVCQVPPEASLADVYRRIAQGGCQIVLVRQADRIVGLLTPEGVRDQLMAAATGRPPAYPPA